MNRRSTIRRVVLLLIGVVAVALPTAADATPPISVTITVIADFGGPVPQGTFTATAPLCPSGTFVTELIAGGGGPVASAFTGLQHFSCENASGTFTIQFHPQVHPPDSSQTMVPGLPAAGPEPTPTSAAAVTLC